MSLHTITTTLVALSIVGLGGGCDSGRDRRSLDGGRPSEGADSGPGLGVSADLTYTLQCRCHGGCVDEDHAIYLEDGERGGEVDCSVATAVEGWVVDFSAREARFGMSITGLQVPVAGGPPSGTCTLRVYQGDLTFEGLCGPGEPSASQPCQVMELERIVDSEGRIRFFGRVWCVDLPDVDDPSDLREVTAPGSSVDPETCSPHEWTGPGYFEVIGCPE